MRTIVSHEVMFLFEEGEGPLVRSGPRQYTFRITGVTVHLSDDGRAPRLHAHGRRCKKDGDLAKRWGYTLTTVDYPAPDDLIAAARDAARGES